MKSLWCLLLVASAFGSLLRAEDEPKPKVEMRIYDVRDLTSTPIDYPAPSMMLHSNQNGIAVFTTNDPVAPEVTTASVAETIRNRVVPDAWDAGLGTSIEERFGQLIVMQTPEHHALIEQMLTSLRRYSKAHVIVKAKLVASMGVPLATNFTPEALKEWVEGKNGGPVLASPRLICANHQLMHLLSGRQFTYVHDLDVSGQLLDPSVCTALDGYVMEFRPTLSNDRTQVALDLKFSRGTQVDRSVTRSVSFASPVLAPAGGPEMRAEIETPTIATCQLNTQVLITTGKWLLAGVMRNPIADAKEHNLLLFVTAEPAEKGVAGKPLTLGEATPAPQSTQPPLAVKAPPELNAAKEF